jgi:hypothetical protein
MTLRLNGSTSGYSEIDAPAIAGDQTFTLPGTGGIIQTVGTSLTLGTAQASTSGTSIDFTGIPSYVKRITVMFNGVSTNGTSFITIRVGTSGGVVSSGYVTGNWSVTTAVASAVANNSTGFEFITTSAGSVHQGALVLSQIDSGAWVGQGSFYDNNPTVRMAYVTGRVTGLASALDRIRITTVNGTDTFDGGSINILTEG